MYLRCPLCDGELYCLGSQANLVAFRIDISGQAAEMRPKGSEVHLSPETTVYCLSCAWCGQVQELQASA